MKIARYGHAAVIFENQLLVCGGFTTDTLDETTDSTDTMEEVYCQSSHQSCWSQVMMMDRLLIIDIGGKSPSQRVFFDTIYELLLVSPLSSKLLCHMKTRASHGVELFNDKVLIADGQGRKTDVEIFGTTRNKCIEMPPFTSRVHFVPTIRRDDAMLLSGEWSEIGKYSNEIIEYDPKSGQGKVLLIMEKERAVSLAVFYENTLIVISGVVENAKAVDCFNFSLNSWKKLPPLTHVRYDASAVVVNKSFEFRELATSYTRNNDSK